MVSRDTSSRSSDQPARRCVTCRSIIPRTRSTRRRVPAAEGQDLQAVAERGEWVPEFVREHRQELVLPPVLLAELFLGPRAVGDVAGEAPGVRRTARPSRYTFRADQDVPDRAVLGAQPGLVPVDRLVGGEPAEDVRDGRRVGVEVGDVPPDVLVPRVPQEVELGPVRPQDRPVRADPVQPDGGVLHEVGQLGLLPPQGPPSARFRSLTSSVTPSKRFGVPSGA